MKTKKIKDLTIGDIKDICNDIKECAKCPLLISSRQKEIICLKDDVIPMIDLEKTAKLMEKEVEIPKNIDMDFF